MDQLDSAGDVSVALAAAGILVLGTATLPIIQHTLGTFAILTCVALKEWGGLVLLQN